MWQVCVLCHLRRGRSLPCIMHTSVCVCRVLTLALIGTISGCRFPRMLVETGAAAVTGAPTGVVLAGTLQPVGQTWAHKGVQDQE